MIRTARVIVVAFLVTYGVGELARTLAATETAKRLVCDADLQRAEELQGENDLLRAEIADAAHTLTACAYLADVVRDYLRTHPDERLEVETW